MSDIFIYRMMHINNISHVLEHGITHSKSKNRNVNYHSIGDNTLINTRDKKTIKVEGRTSNNKITLGNYIPFYFGTRMPMLYVIQKGYNGVKRQSPEHIIYCVSSIQKIIKHRLSFVFTDGHATDGFSMCYESNQIQNINQIVDFSAVKAKDWTAERDLKRKKEAEFLIKDDIPLSAIIGFAVYNKSTKQQLKEIGLKDNMIGIRKEFYF